LVYRLQNKLRQNVSALKEAYMNLRKLLSLTIAAVAALNFGSFAQAHGLQANPHAVISFDEGSALLTERDKSVLRSLVRDAVAKGTIDQITVAAWSDKTLPAQGRKLLDVDRDLAAERADAIKAFLKTDMEVADVDTYNMAENANWLARTFNTRDAELKSVFGRAGADVPVTKDEFYLIKKDGGPSMAVAIVEFKSMHVPPAKK
jgi:hypothetical protein